MKSKHTGRGDRIRPDLEMPLIGPPARTTTWGQKALGGSFSDAEHAPESLTRPDDQRFEHWCAKMGFTSALLTEWGVDQDDLRSLYQQDTASAWLPWLSSHWFRPRSMAFLPERVWLALSMRPAWVSESHAHKACWDPRAWVWVRGIAIPMETSKGYALKLMMGNLAQGAISGFKLTLHIILLISLGIQLRKVIDENPESIWQTLHNGDSESWKRLIYDATGTSARLFWPLIFTPTMLMACSQMILNTLRTFARGRGQLVHMAAELMQQLTSPSLWSSWVRPQLPLDTPSFQLVTLADQLSFDGRPGFTPQYRQKVAQYLMTAIRQTQGFHRLLALQCLERLAVGTHIHNLSEQASAPLSHLFVRIEATRALEAFVRAPAHTKLAWLYQERARYHSWMAGRRTRIHRVMGYTLMRIAWTAYYVYGFRVIVDAILAYLDCPDKTGVSMTGVASWSDDYTQPCFDAYIRFFRQIPGQPLSFLLDIIGRVHFTQPTMPLDLSYKGMNATEIVLIMDALARQGVGVTSLDLSGNFLATADDYHTFMPALARDPSLHTLTLHDVGLESKSAPGADASGTIAMATWLPRLSSLRHLSIQGKWIGSSDEDTMESVATALAQCQQLRTLALVNRGHQYQIDGVTHLTRIMPNLTRLEQLDLSGFLMWNSVARGLASQLPHLRQLEHLSMRTITNWAYAKETAAVLQALLRMPALKTIDFTNSMLDASLAVVAPTLGLEPVLALANVTRDLPHLSELRLNGSFAGFRQLEGGLALADALASRRSPLSVLELAANSFSKRTADALNAVLSSWQLPLIPVQFRNANETKAYLAGLTPGQTHLELDDGPQNDESLRTLFLGIRNTSIIDLRINGLRFDPSARGFEGLAENTQLQFLKLAHSKTVLTTTVSRTENWLFFLQAISQLKALRGLLLPRTNMLYNDDDLAVARALAETLHNSTNLEHLDLSNMFLGEGFDGSTPIVLRSFAHLTKLRTFSLGGNNIHWYTNGSAMLVSQLRHLPHLTSLDISSTGWGSEKGATRALANYLSQINLPFRLIAPQTRLGYHADEAQELMIAIADNPHITATLLDAGFGSQLWPPQVARLASATYDPYLQAACSNLQCFGIQPTLPDLGNSTRIDFEQQAHPLKTSQLRSALLLVTTMLVTLLVGIGYGLFRRRRHLATSRVGSPRTSEAFKLDACPSRATDNRPLSQTMLHATP